MKYVLPFVLIFLVTAFVFFQVGSRYTEPVQETPGNEVTVAVGEVPAATINVNTEVSVVRRKPVSEADCAELRAELEELRCKLEDAGRENESLRVALAAAQWERDSLRFFVSDPKLFTFIADPELRGLTDDDIEIVAELVQTLGFVPAPWEAKEYLGAWGTNDSAFAAWNEEFLALEGGFQNPNWPLLEAKRDEIYARYKTEVERIWHDPVIVQTLFPE